MELFKRLSDEGITIIQVTPNEKNAAYGHRVNHLVDWLDPGFQGNGRSGCEHVNSGLGQFVETESPSAIPNS